MQAEGRTTDSVARPDEAPPTVETSRELVEAQETSRHGLDRVAALVGELDAVQGIVEIVAELVHAGQGVLVVIRCIPPWCRRPVTVSRGYTKRGPPGGGRSASHGPRVQLHSTIGDVDHEVLDVAGAASYLGVSERTFGELVLDDQIPHGHDGRRRTFTRPQLDLYLAKARIRPGDIAYLTGPKVQGRYRGR